MTAYDVQATLLYILFSHLIFNNTYFDTTWYAAIQFNTDAHHLELRSDARGVRASSQKYCPYFRHQPLGVPRASALLINWLQIQGSPRLPQVYFTKTTYRIQENNIQTVLKLCWT